LLINQSTSQSVNYSLH